MTSPRAREVYGYDLFLLRPDMHIVWRGNRPPDNAEQLVRRADTDHRSRSTVQQTGHAMAKLDAVLEELVTANSCPRP